MAFSIKLQGSDGPDVMAALADFTTIRGTPGNDVLIGTAGRDNILINSGGDGGKDTVRGLDGDDYIFVGDSLSGGDRIDGGDGKDAVKFAERGQSLELDPRQFIGIEVYRLDGGFGGSIIIRDGFDDFRISSIGTGFSEYIDASAVTTGSLTIEGGNNIDTIIGGQLDDILTGGDGADTLTGGNGRDRFGFRYEDSSSDLFGIDTITDFSSGETIRLPDLLHGYQIGETRRHTGDVILTYDSVQDRTTINVFTDGDSIEDMTIYISGQHLDLVIRNDFTLVGS